MGFRGGGRGGRRPFDSPPRHDAGGFRMFGGSGSGGGGGRGDRFDRGGSRDFEGEFLDMLPPPPPQQLSGQKRGFGFPGRAEGGSPHSSEHPNEANFAKLFVGSVPRNVTEDDIRPLFEQHGHVIEVAMIRDKRTGQQQGCCFIKFATSDEANRAIRALHNQYTLPGGIGLIQVRYADGERERLGAFEYKLFIGSLNKQASEKEVEEIFSPYGRVEDVYLMRDEMKQSRGCGFVKYSQREMAVAAIVALNGSYTMRGCDQPLTVRFADPKRPRLSDSRAPPNLSEPTEARTSENSWHPRIGLDMGPSSVSGPRDFSGQLLPKSSDSSIPLYPQPRLGITEDGHRSTPAVSSSVPLPGINQPSPQLPLMHRQISPSQNPFHSPQNFPSSLTLQNQPTTSYSQTLTSYPKSGPMPTPFTQPIPSQPVVGPSGQFSASRPFDQQITTPATVPQHPLSMNLQYQHRSSLASQQQMASPVLQQSAHPFQQSPSPLAQMLSQQTQSLQASFQSSRQVFSQLQQQLQLMQPSSEDSSAPSESQATNSQLNRNMQHRVASSSSDTPGADLPSSTIALPKCSWTEHTSPDGFQYYYNSATGESRWVEPDELKIFKHQQPQDQVKETVHQPQIQSNPLVLRPHQGPQIQQMQLQTQLQSQLPQQSFQQTSISSELGYAQYRSAANLIPDSASFQQGVPVAQDWTWKSKQTGI